MQQERPPAKERLQSRRTTLAEERTLADHLRREKRSSGRPIRRIVTAGAERFPLKLLVGSSYKRVLSAMVFIVLLLPAPYLSAQSLILSSEIETVRLIAEVAGDVWIAGDSGAFRLEDKGQKHLLGNFRVYAISEVDNHLWLGSEAGIYRIEGERAQPFLREELGAQNINAIESYGGIVFVGTNRGLWTIENGVASGPSFSYLVHDIVEIDGEIWVAARGNALRRDKDGTVRELFEHRANVSAIVKASSSTWIITSGFGQKGALYVVDDDRPTLVYPRGNDLIPAFEVISIGDIESSVYLGTTRGLFHLNESFEPIRVDFPDEPVNTIATLEDRIYIGTTQGVYFKRGEEYLLIGNEDEINVKEIVQLAGKTWVRTTSGAFRVEYAASRLGVVPGWLVVLLSLLVLLLFYRWFQRRRQF